MLHIDRIANQIINHQHSGDLRKEEKSWPYLFVRGKHLSCSFSHNTTYGCGHIFGLIVGQISVRLEESQKDCEGYSEDNDQDRPVAIHPLREFLRYSHLALLSVSQGIAPIGKFLLHGWMQSGDVTLFTHQSISISAGTICESRCVAVCEINVLTTSNTAAMMHRLPTCDSASAPSRSAVLRHS